MARNDVYLNINALSPADAVVTGQQDMTAATVPELVLGDTPTFNFYFTDNTNVWPSWAGNAAYTLTWALSDAVAGDFAPAATTGNATPITGGWSVILPLNSYDLVGLLNTKRVGQPYPVQNLWQQLRVTDPSGNEVTRAMFWTPIRYRAISDTQNTESASPTGGRFVTVNNVNALTTPTAAQFYAANPVPTSALGSAANGELLIGDGTGFTKATLTAGSGVSITNGSGSITISATDGDITLDDGTAAAPSLKFTADTDTGIYRPSDNVLGISAGGVSRATFGATSAINGTTIPGSKTLVVTTDKLSALAATTSAELAGVISDETGTGALVFANTPTLVTPNIGAATGTSFNLTGSGTLGTTLTVNGTTDSTNKDTGAIVTEGGLGVEKSATIGGNLTVSGTGTTGGVFTASSTGSSPAKIGTGFAGFAEFSHSSTFGVAGTYCLIQDSTGETYLNTASGKNLSLRVANSNALVLTGTGGTLAGNLTVSGTGNSSVAGKFLIGTTTDVTAYKLQVYGATSASVIAANGVTPDGTKTGGIFGTALGGTGSATGSYASAGDIAGRFVMNAYGNNFIYEAASMQAEITTGGNADRNLHVAALDFYTKGTGSNIVTRNMRLTGSGNLLVGTVIDGGQKLQVNGTAAISGNLTVSGTIYPSGASATLTASVANTIIGSNGATRLQIDHGNGGWGRLQIIPQQTRADISAVLNNATTAQTLGLVGSSVEILTSGGTLAATFNSSQNTTLAGNLTVSGTQNVLGLPASASALGTNSTMTFELTSNTSLTIKVRGTDGTTRSVALTLA